MAMICLSRFLSCGIPRICELQFLRNSEALIWQDKSNLFNKTLDWFHVQLPTVQSLVQEAKKNQAFSAVLSNELFSQQVAKQMYRANAQVGGVALGLSQYIKKVSFDDQLRSGQRWFAHTPLSRTLLHFRVDARYQFLYSFTTKVPMAAVGSSSSIVKKNQTASIASRSVAAATNHGGTKRSSIKSTLVY
ncbi:hypothetical protein [Alkalihalobacterium chitinilyticum]|uniref:Uncharacterized protein n=1 Tax=Alkalihalobacterium chitinilyticum TaxID=2980103 RepID=A0ABT5VFH5_9BACI|nr:hypothetical protein [Alkalihalobacterium chitinilyticum]MDE5414201.1 hypothetical protein [Alkalihalobacterium chitinilyticum]